MTEITSLDGIVQAVLARGHIPRVAIARCAEEFVLKAGIEAWRRGIAEPVLLGDIPQTQEIADSLGLDISPFETHYTPDDETAVREAVRLFREGEASLLMKGRVPTGTLLKAILDKEHGVPPKGILSHVTVFEAPGGGRLMLMSDAGVNIRPNLQRKADILKNTLKVAHRLGIARPKAAVLAATEKVNYPAMPATLDADVLSRMSGQGEFGDAVVFGPLSLDLALSKQVAECKGVTHPVAGCADVLLTPDIESGNILYKSLSTFYRATLASVVVGSRVPVVVPSRGDSDASKFHSIALAVYLSEENA